MFSDLLNFSLNFQIFLSLLVLCSFNQLSDCVIANQTRRIVPLRARISFPKTHERIMVPVDPIKIEDKVEVPEKPVTEIPVESNVRRKKNRTKYSVETEAPMRSRQAKRTPEIYDDGKGNYRNSQSYVSRSDNPRSHKDANRIQPLHINTKVFKKKRPQQAESTKPPQDDKHKIKLEHLPANPTEIPTTTWFDNTGKYYYGIVHDETFTEPPEYSEKQQIAPQEQVTELPPHNVFKSSFRDPKYVEPLVYNDGLGNFLYKSEIHYPSYRTLLYPPVTIYGAQQNAKPATKELPTPVVQKKSHQVAAPKKTLPEPRVKPAEKAKQTPPPPQDEPEDYEEDSSEDDEDGPSNDRYDGEAPGEGELSLKTFLCSLIYCFYFR